MSPVERKQIEDMAKEAGIQGDDIPNVVDIQMRIYLADDSRGTINEILLKNYEKLGKNQYTLKVPATEHELKKLESENLTELDLINSAYFWGYKYLETTRVDHLKSLVSYDEFCRHLPMNLSIYLYFILEKSLRCHDENEALPNS